MDCVSKRERATRSKESKIQIVFKRKSEVTWIYALTFYQFVKIVPMQIVPKHSVLSKSVLRPFCLEAMVYSPLLFVFLFTFTQSSARSAETFSMYTSFSYGLLKKGARAARKMFQYITHVSYGLLKRRVRAARNIFQVLSQFSQSCSRYVTLSSYQNPEIFCVAKIQTPAHPKSLCR